MVNILAKFFIKDNKNVSNPKVRQAYGLLCGALGIFLNVLLFAGKFIAGTISNSIAITADAFNNLSDAGSSLVTLLGFKLSAAKPDPEHPFGHGRIEYISGLIVSAAILLMAYELIRDSIDKIINPASIEFSILSIVILIVSIIVKLYMAYYNKTIGNKINSAAMTATSFDSLSDSVATTVVLIATLVSHFFDIQIDGYCGVLVGLFIFYAGYNAAKETLGPLLGQPPEAEFVKQVEKIVMSYEPVFGIHDMVVHDYVPGRLMISLHAEVPAENDILEIHDVIDNIEQTLQKELNCAAVIHMDPVVTKDERVTKLKEATYSIINEIDPEIKMHDFRVVLGPTHNNLIFDVLVPFKYKLSDDELKLKISEEISKKIGNNNFAVICIDKAYV